jgi:hypothetical protein
MYADESPPGWPDRDCDTTIPYVRDENIPLVFKINNSNSFLNKY